MSPDDILKALNAYDEELTRILGRFNRTRDGIFIDQQDNYRLRTLAVELIDLLHDHIPGSLSHQRQVTGLYNEGNGNFFGGASYSCVADIQAVVKAVITRVSRNRNLFEQTKGPLSPERDNLRLVDDLDRIVLRFHAVVQQLRKRRENRPTLDVADEYDVQDLMHALLRLNFDDIRAEEWAPSHAGAASRTDFLLPQIETIVEIKKTRQGLADKQIGEQLIIDIARYKAHPQCKRLMCFVYDPDGRIVNPAGLENDINNGDHGIEVHVSVVPKST